MATGWSVGTIDFNAQMPGIKFRKGDENLRPFFEILSGCLKWNLGGPWTLTVEARALQMEPRMICRPLLADSHQFDEEQDPDPRVPYVKRLIRIRIK